MGPLLALLAGSLAAQQSTSFELDVLPMLQRYGCSAADCHGGATGRGGFKLSLFGSDPDADFAALALDLDGRRIDPALPERSLALQKALGGLGHGGGVRFDRGDPPFEALREWIAEGARRHAPGEAELLDLELGRDGNRLTAQAHLAGPGDVGPLTEEVRERVRWSSVHPDVVSVDADGRLTRHRPGPATLLGRFGHLTASLRWVEPFAEPVRTPDVAHELDRAWLGELAVLGLEPGPEVDRPRLLRRLFLDLVGRPPRLDEFAAWARPSADLAPVVDALLGSDDFVDLWSLRFARALGLAEEPDLAPPERQRRAALRAEVGRWLAADRPLSELPSFALLEQPRFVEAMADPRDRAEWVTHRLMGLRLECARCHDHPLDRWRQRDHLAFSAWLAPPRAAADGEMEMGRVFDPADQRAVAPAPLPIAWAGAEPLDPARRLAQVASFVAEADGGRQLARHWSGVVFATLMGRGLTDPADDHRPGNPPVLPDVRDALAAAFDCDSRPRALLRWLVRSRYYRTASAAPAAELTFAWTHRQRREMPSEVWPRAVAGALGVPVAADPLPAEPIARVLAQWHGEAVDGALRGGGTTVDAILEFGGDDAARLRELFVKILSRPPTEEEALAFGEVFDDGGDAERVRDLAQALLLSREFRELR